MTDSSDSVAPAGSVYPADSSAPWGNAELAATIDHTLLKPESTEADVVRLCGEARLAQTASVCINSRWVATAARELAGSGVRVCTVVGFPLGACSARAKAEETRIAVADGAEEIDMVLSIGEARSGDWSAVEQDIRGVVSAAESGLVKVILETALLTDEQKVSACRAAVAAGADFVKTSTGFSSGGATLADVALMRQTVGPDVGVKASGGIRTRADAVAMLQAGAQRLGCSSTLAILDEEVI